MSENPTLLYIPLSAKDMALLNAGGTVKIETNNADQGFTEPTVIMIRSPHDDEETRD